MADSHEPSRPSVVDYIASRIKNPYGFHIKHYSFHRFATLIGVDKKSAEFEGFMKNLNDLRKQFLSLDHPPMEQRSSLEHMKIRGYPHIFERKNGQKHLYFALHIIMHHHVNERSDIKRVKRKATNVPKIRNERSAVSNIIQQKEPIQTANTIDLTDEQNINSIIRNITPIVPPLPDSIIVSRPARRAIQIWATSKSAYVLSGPRRHSSPSPQHTSGTSSAQGYASGSSQPNHGAVAMQNPPKENDVPGAPGRPKSTSSSAPACPR
ncbi:hypothetical protein BJ912DRAFT_549844 [Pholiota molesta]|nr:hypothetical protein BJ912DRAFT_549844 [Pholiota molesta]